LGILKQQGKFRKRKIELSKIVFIFQVTVSIHKKKYLGKKIKINKIHIRIIL